ncbi:MAG: PQQ-like beta-propeller repeat protein [Spirochaetaceae bacterium]|jgi:hypothetical protein|nr:PQQ-like beta-propeller repeat protein [Spirochaetaceae bacterium]
MKGHLPFRFRAVPAVLIYALLCCGKTVSDISSSVPDPAWRTAIAGTIVSGPFIGGSGFVFAGDDRALYSFREDGRQLWRVALPGRATPHITVTGDGFIIAVTDRRRVHLYNPDGRHLWQVTVPEQPSFPPVQGRDGRIFILSDTRLLCYSVTGKLKWQLKVPGHPLSKPNTLDDGSLLLLLQDREALHISPWGELRKRFKLPDSAAVTVDTGAGTVIGFTGGGIACYSASGGSPETRWSSMPGGSAPGRSAESGSRKIRYLCAGNSGDGGGILLAVGSDSFIYAYNIVTGETEWGIFEYDIYPDKIQSISYHNGIFNILAGSVGVGYTIEGALQWKRALPAQASASVYTAGGYLVTGGKEWIITGYKLDAPIVRKGQYNPERSYGHNRKDFQPELNGSVRQFMDSAEQAIRTGAAGEKESEYIEGLASIALFRPPQGSANLGMRDAEYPATPGMIERSRAMLLLGESGSLEARQFLVRVLETEDNGSLRTHAVKALGTLAFDPDGAALKAIQEAVLRPAVRDDSFYFAVCDSVYEICRFMGIQGLRAGGLDILKAFMQERYGMRVYFYAARTLEKLSL